MDKNEKRKENVSIGFYCFLRAVKERRWCLPLVPMLVLMLVLMLFLCLSQSGCSGGDNACSRICTWIADCYSGAGLIAPPCPLSNTCMSYDQCKVDCYDRSSCDAVIQKNMPAYNQLQACISQCGSVVIDKSVPVEYGGRTDLSDLKVEDLKVEDLRVNDLKVEDLRVNDAGVLDSFSCNGCEIDGKCYAPNALNPSNSCQVCNPTKSTTAWSPSDKGCMIGGKCYLTGALNPANNCQKCDPSLSTMGWTQIPGCSPTCPTGYGDCNTDPVDGCEANLQTDANNCGSCSNACGTNDLCIGSKCTLTIPGPSLSIAAWSTATNAGIQFNTIIKIRLVDFQFHNGGKADTVIVAKVGGAQLLTVNTPAGNAAYTVTANLDLDANTKYRIYAVNSGNNIKYVHKPTFPQQNAHISVIEGYQPTHPDATAAGGLSYRWFGIRYIRTLAL